MEEEESCVEMEQEVDTGMPEESSADDPLMEDKTPSPPTTRSRKREKVRDPRTHPMYVELV